MSGHTTSGPLMRPFRVMDALLMAEMNASSLMARALIAMAMELSILSLWRKSVDRL